MRESGGASVRHPAYACSASSGRMISPIDNGGTEHGNALLAATEGMRRARPLYQHDAFARGTHVTY